tara:strand:- start:12289 stop:12405 length:117 start_codon:yes stop_codon:yes gene_type:complete
MQESEGGRARQKGMIAYFFTFITFTIKALSQLGFKLLN